MRGSRSQARGGGASPPPQPEGTGPAARPAASPALHDATTSRRGLFLTGSRGWPPSRLAGILKHTLSDHQGLAVLPQPLEHLRRMGLEVADGFHLGGVAHEGLPNHGLNLVRYQSECQRARSLSGLKCRGHAWFDEPRLWAVAWWPRCQTCWACYFGPSRNVFPGHRLSRPRDRAGLRTPASSPARLIPCFPRFAFRTWPWWKTCPWTGDRVLD